MRRSAIFLRTAAAVLLAAGSVAASAEPVLLISIDGLRPGDVTEASQRGLKLPNLTAFLREGTWASGVVGVLPTLTYPSHTTLLTGASPARHGIVGNTTFDPLQINQRGWDWYASDIKVPTLWSAAAADGHTVANIHWPVSVGAKGVTWNLPQIWRTGHGDDAKLLSALATPGLVAALERETGEPYAQGIDESITGDENRARFAARLIATRKPDLVTVYLAALDDQEHVEGPDTPGAHAVLERIDAVVGKLVAAELKARPDAVIAVVSDHGFEPISTETSLFRAFIDAGLIRLDAAGKIAGWDATIWPSGGSAAVILARPDDAVLKARVADVLAAIKADPQAGISAIADAAQITAMRGNPQASFYVDFMPGVSGANFAVAGAPLAGPAAMKGTHGYFPAAPHMRSTFLIRGHGIPRGRALGEIDMRAIAPTLARIMKVRLSGAEVKPLAF